MRFSSRGGVKLHIKLVGEQAGRPACLLIHGLNANMAFWHPQFVRALHEDRNVVMYDQRGHGYSEMPPTGYTPTDLARDAASLLDEVGIDQIDLVAHSFGTVVALQFVTLYPQRVRSLVILDGRIRLLQPHARLGDWKLFDQWRQHFEDAGVRLTADMDLDYTLPLYLTGANMELIGDKLARDGFFVPAKGERASAKYRKLLTETTASREFRDQACLTMESLHGTHVPTLAVYGTNSPFQPTLQGLMREIPGCTSALIEGGGHNFPFMKPVETSDAIRTFWKAIATHGAP